MTILTRPGNHPHIEWIELQANGILTECAVLKRDGFGNIFFFEVTGLDHIDKQRLTRIIHGRSAKQFELWDLMSQITLNNGINALEYFHQLVKVISVDGVIYNPKSGVVGGRVDVNDPTTQSEIPANAMPESVTSKRTSTAKTSTAKAKTTK